MQTRRSLSILVGAICLGLLCVAYHQWRERDELRLQTAAMFKRNAALEMEVQRVARAVAARSAAKAETPRVSEASGSRAVAPARRPILRSPGLIELARDNPGLWNEFISLQKAEVAQRYGPLFENLGLSTDRREQFKVIIAAQAARSADIAAAADAQQLQRDDSVVAALRKQSWEQAQSELAILLGERGAIELKEYERTIQVRGFADGLAIQLARLEPLSGQQADRLTRALASASAGFLKGEIATSADLDWLSADEQARAILTPTQFAVWQQGTAHNRNGGSRRDVELKKLYDQTVKATQPADGATQGK